MKNALMTIIACLALALSSTGVFAQAASNYDTLVRQGNTQLQAGDNDRALTAAKSAIKLNVERWEAYAVAGGALLNLKRYEEAADDFSEAIKHAPAAKQDGLRDLRRKCLLAEPGASPSPSASTSPAPAPPTATTQGEIVLWKTIENSANYADFQTYLSQYPNGAFVGLARRHLSDLKTQIEKASQAMKVLAEQEQQKETWIDPYTTLMLPKREINDDKNVFFSDAVNYCANLRLLGYSDWRLPTVAELVSAYQQGSSWKPPTLKSLWTSTSSSGQDAHMVLSADGKSHSKGDWTGGAFALCVRYSGAGVHGTAVSEQ
jgi:tetratricopeptide (TPR) repeat protein